jgi:hypothetical protein
MVPKSASSCPCDDHLISIFRSILSPISPHRALVFKCVQKPASRSVSFSSVVVDNFLLWFRFWRATGWCWAAGPDVQLYILYSRVRARIILLLYLIWFICMLQIKRAFIKFLLTLAHVWTPEGKVQNISVFDYFYTRYNTKLKCADMPLVWSQQLMFNQN